MHIYVTILIKTCYILMIELEITDWTGKFIWFNGKLTFIPFSMSAWESNCASMPIDIKDKADNE